MSVFMKCMNFLHHFHDCYSRYTGAPSQSQSQVRVGCGALGDRRAPLFCVNSDAWTMNFQGGLVGGWSGGRMGCDYMWKMTFFHQDRISFWFIGPRMVSFNFTRCKGNMRQGRTVRNTKCYKLPWGVFFSREKFGLSDKRDYMVVR